MSVLVNGAPTLEFSMSMGVRQGDLLSPFLFVLAMEALNIVMIKGVNLGIFHSISTPKEGPCISHLLYVDDT